MSYEVVPGAELEVSRDNVITVSGSAYPVESPIEVWLHSTPVLVASTISDYTGAFETTFAVPNGVTDGEHILQIISGTAPEVASTALALLVLPDQNRLAAPTAQLPRTGNSEPAASLVLIGLGALLMIASRRPAIRQRHH